MPLYVHCLVLCYARTRACACACTQALMHPRSVYTLPGIWAGCNEFGGFGDAADVLHNAEALEEMADRVRFFGEACDSLQGGLDTCTCMCSCCSLTALQRRPCTRLASRFCACWACTGPRWWPWSAAMQFSCITARSPQPGP